MAKSPSTKLSKITYQRQRTIGAADARDDRFLEDCFVDTGAIESIQDVESPECVLLGRTGSGKTALLRQLEIREKRVINIEPENLSLSYVENSSIIRLFLNAGVNMEPFYRLLWRHVFVVELIKSRYNIVNKLANDNLLVKLRDIVRTDKTKEAALEYFFEYGDSFWEETAARVVEVTKRVEHDLSKSVSGKVGGFFSSLSAGADVSKQWGDKFSEEEKGEIHYIGQQVVQQVQIQKLNSIMELLEENIFDDPQKHYYITIDRLDEGWVDDALRYQLIRSLLETARDVNQRVRNAKMIIAIREDLLDRVFRYTRSPGYQEEKYRSMYIQLNWNKTQLQELLLKRVRYLKNPDKNADEDSSIQLEDIMPLKLHVRRRETATIDYILERTLLRPRDVILYFNECISRVSLVDGKITQKVIFQAEEAYSELRLRSLSDEWAADYPTLYDAVLALRNYPSQFTLSDIDRSRLGKFLLDYLAEHDSKSACEIYQAIFTKFYLPDVVNLDTVIYSLLKVFFKVGILCVNSDSQQMRWGYLGDKFPSEDKLDNLSFSIHPAFWKVLEVKA